MKILWTTKENSFLIQPTCKHSVIAIQKNLLLICNYAFSVSFLESNKSMITFLQNTKKKKSGRRSRSRNLHFEPKENLRSGIQKLGEFIFKVKSKRKWKVHTNILTHWHNLTEYQKVLWTGEWTNAFCNIMYVIVMAYFSI